MESLDDFEAAMEHKKSYQSSLVKAMGSVLDAFYASMSRVGVSAVTGQGMPQCLAQIERCKMQWNTQYQPMRRRKRERALNLEKERRRKMDQQIDCDVANNTDHRPPRSQRHQTQRERALDLGRDQSGDGHDADGHDDDGGKRNDIQIGNEQKEDVVQQIDDDEQEILSFLQK